MPHSVQAPSVELFDTSTQFEHWVSLQPLRRDARRILICGSRSWTDYDAIASRVRVLAKLDGPTVVIQGQAAGADSIARDAVLQLALPSITVVGFPADWSGRGRRAGFERNNRMLACRPELVIGFTTSLNHSRGTRQMLDTSYRAGVPVEIHELHRIRTFNPTS